jgi:hypothetical protein
VSIRWADRALEIGLGLAYATASRSLRHSERPNPVLSAFVTKHDATGSITLPRMGRGTRARWPAILVGLLGAGLLWCASASAEPGEQNVAFGQVPNVATVGSTYGVLVYLNGPDYGGDILSLSSLTPNVCTVSETTPARCVSAEVHASGLGACTLSARGETAAAEAVEMQDSFNVVVARTPKVTWRVRAKKTVGGKGIVELASPARAGSELSSTTPAVCKLTPVSNNTLPAEITDADVRFSAPGKCTIVAHVKGAGEYNSAQAQKSFEVSPRKRHRS